MSSAYNPSTSFGAKSERRTSSEAPIATAEADKSDEECSSKNINTCATYPEPAASPAKVNLAESSSNPAPSSPKFFLDASFSQNFGVKNYQNFDEPLFTFEEFLDYTDKPVLSERIDEFDSIALDSPRPVPQGKRQPKGKELDYIATTGLDSQSSNLSTARQETPSTTTTSGLPVADFSHLQTPEASPLPTNVGPISLSAADQANMGLIRMLCCIRPQNRSSRYHATSQTIETTEPPRPTQYSWDVNRADPKDYMFSQRTGEVMIKKAGEIDGQQFVIENCKDCIVIILDHSGAITIDDCEDCLFVFGPCSGSVFIRNCTKCFCYSISKQFRVRDSRLYAHIFSSTPPVIEESNVDFFPLFMNYDDLDDHMIKANLSPYCNAWNKVYDFTPSKQATHYRFNYDPPETEVEDKLGLIASAYQLSFTKEHSFLVHPDVHKVKGNEETALVLHKQEATDKDNKHFYEQSKDFIRQVLNDEGVILVNVVDITIQKGDLQSTLPVKLGLKLSGHIAILEFQGKTCRRHVNAIVAEFNKSCINQKSLPFELIQSESKENLYKFAEMKHSV